MFKDKGRGLRNTWQSFAKIQESASKFGITCTGGKEAIHILVGENKQAQNGNYVMYQYMNIFYIHCNLIGGNVNDLAIRLSSDRGENANDKADVGNISAQILWEVKSPTEQQREGGQGDRIYQNN